MAVARASGGMHVVGFHHSLVHDLTWIMDDIVNTRNAESSTTIFFVMGHLKHVQRLRE